MTAAEQQLLAEWLECRPALVCDELVDALIAIQDDPERLSLVVLDFVYSFEEDEVEAHTLLAPLLEMTPEQTLKIPTPIVAHIWQLEAEKLLLKLGCYERRVPICLQP